MHDDAKLRNPQVRRGYRAADDFRFIAQRVREMQAERSPGSKPGAPIEPEDLGIVDAGGGSIAIHSTLPPRSNAAPFPEDPEERRRIQRLRAGDWDDDDGGEGTQ